ncbi:hypothetical protein LCGC14_0334500 [marine sediment metagenome]|uniref:Uncharacterized protein n=1 Tax=marine sediment metagenome TaxID=412755 RepID=A0A0F9TYA2_9ZZZZ
MPMIQISKQGSPCQVDDFPEKTKRSCDGALYLRPGTARSVTEDELHHINATPVHAALAARITVISEPRKRVAVPKAKPSPARFSDGKSDKKSKDK